MSDPLGPWRRAGLVLALTLFAAACGSAPPAAGQVEHVVLVWLKDPDAAEVKDRIAAVSHGFADRIPGILSLTVGEPLPSERAIVDDSFDLALIVRFRDAQALADYLVHPVHVAAVESLLGPNVDRILVYDSLLR